MQRRALPVALVLLATLSCLEPPVTESLDLHMKDGGASRVAITVALRDPRDYDRSPRVRQRVEDEARALEAGTDAWAARLRAAAPSRDKTTAEREGGVLRRVQREADLDEPADLAALFRDTGIGVSYAEGAGWAEVTIVPGSPRRATSAQRQAVRAEVSRFSEAAAAYVEAVAALYAHLDAHSDRAPVCLGRVVSAPPGGDALLPEEEPLVEAVEGAMESLGEVLAVAPEEALTFDELSALVHDPFPARLTVSVPGKLLERDGFPGAFDSALAIPRLSIWSAYQRLSGRWFAPDLALEMWTHDREDGEHPIDVGLLAAKPRHVKNVPSAAEVRRAIEGDMTPAPAYRARWERPD